MKDFSFVVKAYHELLSDGKYMDQQLILIAIILVIIWVGTVAVLAEQAEIKGKRPGLIIVSGLIVPILGAVAMFFIAPSKKGKEEAEEETVEPVESPKQKEVKKKAKEQPEEEFKGSYRKDPNSATVENSAEVDHEVEEVVEEPQEEQVVIDQSYFQELKNKYGKDKNYVIFAGEQQYNVVELIEAMPALIVAMVRDEYEKEHRMRIPYSKITDVKY